MSKAGCNNWDGAVIIAVFLIGCLITYFIFN